MERVWDADKFRSAALPRRKYLRAARVELGAEMMDAEQKIKCTDLLESISTPHAALDKKVARDCFVLAVMISILSLECTVDDCLGRADFAGAMAACAETVPIMNKYMDDPNDRQTKILKRWKACCDRIGIDWGKIEKRDVA